MTRSRGVSQRKSFNQAVRERAAQEHTSFASVLEQVKDTQTTRAYRSMLNLPSHLNRISRRDTLSDHLYPAPDLSFGEENEDCGDDGERRAEAKPVFDLLAIAKPKKARGVAKEFEIVEKVKSVIVLEEEETASEYEVDDWETVEYDIGVDGVAVESRRTYSAALAGR